MARDLFAEAGVAHEYQPRDLFAEAGIVPQEKETSFGQDLMGAVKGLPQGLMNAAIGAGDLIREPLQNLLRTGASNDKGDPLGNFIAKNVPEYRPGAEGYSYALGNVGPQVVGALGAAKSLGIPAAKWLSHKIGTGLLKVAPETIAKGTLSELTGGKNLEEGAQELASQIGSAYLKNKRPLEAGYEALKSKFGHLPIYSRAPKHGYEMPSRNPINMEEATVAERFQASPTYGNARDYISQLKDKSRDLKEALSVKGADKQEIRRELERTVNSLKSIEKDTYKFLRQQDPAAAKYLKELNKGYATLVQPYRTKALTRKLVESMDRGKGIAGAEINLGNLANVFKSPKGSNSIQRIVSDIGPNGIRNILAQQLGKAKDAKDLVTKFKSLENSQLASYITPQLRKEVMTIEKALKRKKHLKFEAGALGLGALGYGGYHGIGSLLGANDRYSHGGSE